MTLIADGLLIATALTAGLYCLVLSRRLRRLTEAGNGLPGQIEALNRALEETRGALADTRHGVAQARGDARSATETLTREVLAARQAIQEVERATTRAGETLARLRAAERWGDDPGEEIPDWPDGVVPEPAGADSAEESAQPGAPPDGETEPAGAGPDAPLAAAAVEGRAPGQSSAEAALPAPAEDAARGDRFLRVQRMAL